MAQVECLENKELNNMAAYGKGQMLGSGISPESFKQDYSGFSRAAEIQAQGLQNLGQSIGGAIQNYGEMKKLQQADERAVQKSKSVAKAIGDLIPDLQPTLQNSLAILDNKELPLSQRKAEAEAISDILNLGIGEIRNRQQVEIEKAQLLSRGTSSTSPMSNAKLVEIAVPGGTQQMFLRDGVLEPIQLNQQTSGVEFPAISSDAIDQAINLNNIPSGAGTENLPPTGDGAPEYDPTATNILLGQGSVGFTPSKSETVETFRPFTSEEVALYGSQGQVSSTGKVYPIRPPSGTEFTTNPDGSTTYRQGAGVGSKAEALAKTKRASEFEETRQSNFITDKANEAEEIIDYSISTYGPGTLIDMAKSTIPGTQEYKLKNQILPAIKDSIALSSLKQLKAASPTGASGLGSLTEKEGKRLENMYGVLDVGGDKVTLKNDLKRLKQTVFDYIHGTKSEREKALADGDITKEQNDQVEQMYREQILGLIDSSAPTSTEDFGISPAAQAARERQKQRRNKQ